MTYAELETILFHELMKIPQAWYEAASGTNAGYSVTRLSHYIINNMKIQRLVKVHKKFAVCYVEDKDLTYIRINIFFDDAKPFYISYDIIKNSINSTVHPWKLEGWRGYVERYKDASDMRIREFE